MPELKLIERWLGHFGDFLNKYLEKIIMSEQVLNIFEITYEDVEQHIETVVCKDLSDEQINLKIQAMQKDDSDDRQETYWKLKNRKKVGEKAIERLNKNPVRDYETLMKPHLQEIVTERAVIKDGKIETEQVKMYTFIQNIETMGEHHALSESGALELIRMNDEHAEQYAALKQAVLDGNEAVIPALYKLEKQLIAEYNITNTLLSIKLGGIVDEQARDEHMLAKYVARRAFKGFKMRALKAEILRRKASKERRNYQSKTDKFFK